MKFPSSLIKIPLLVVCLLLAAAMPVLAAGDDWRPVDPKELALKAPVVERDADAEALFWEVRVDDGEPGELIFTHYIRIKVFTERGRESESKIDIPFGKIFGSDIKIKEVAARTIKPDGSIIELKREDIFERDIIKANRVRLRAKSFAMPGVEPGSILEYRWREVRANAWANYTRLHFQREIPVQTVKYYIKPAELVEGSMRAQVFHGGLPPVVKEKNGFYSMTMTNMPAYHEEPRMPPEDQVRTWVLIYYTRLTEQVEPQKFWKDFGKSYYDRTKTLIKPNDDVKKAALSVTGDAATPDEKLERLYNFVRTKIKNIYDDASNLSAEEIAKAKTNRSPSDTLKRGMGHGLDIDLLFAALANAAGFDARIVLVADRGDIFFDPSFTNPYFLEPYNVAVKVGDQWRFFDPGFNHVPPGMLRWQEEGQDALVTDPKEPVWVKTPVTPAEKSLVKRTAKLTLSDDGTLEGDVEIQYTGQLAIERKEENDEETTARREELLISEIKEQMSTAELTNIRVENVTDPDKPFTYAYHVRVPGYAERTGKRLFLRPAFFQHGINPMFPTSDRENLVYFHYPWSEKDSVEITLPQGYDLDSADVPTPIGAGKVSQYTVRMAVTEDKRTLIYSRTFTFGTPEIILFPKSTYPALKEYFDQLNKADNHTITLKQGTARAAASQ
jgi:transglutaminase-like putative cysteine protease